jgi:hypothetical protein
MAPTNGGEDEDAVPAALLRNQAFVLPPRANDEPA